MRGEPDAYRFLHLLLDRSESGELVATSQNLEVEDAVAFADSVAAIRRHMEDGASDDIVLEVSSASIDEPQVLHNAQMLRVYLDAYGSLGSDREDFDAEQGLSHLT